MRFVAHIFVHNFYLTKILSLNPGLTGTPAAVIKNNKIIDVSPEAAVYGLLPGFTRRNALQTCPGLHLFEYNPDIYEEPGNKLSSICYGLSPRVETLNQNERFTDLSGSTPPSAGVFNYLAKSLVPEIGSYITISIAANRLLAKASTMISTTILKPSGIELSRSAAGPERTVKFNNRLRFFIIKNETASEFASTLPVEALWTLESPLIKRLKTLGLKTFGDISHIPLTLLYRHFGAAAPLIRNYSLGLDESRVPVMTPPETIVCHYPCPGADRVQLEQLLKKAAADINTDLQEQGKSYRDLRLTLCFENDETKTKTSSFTRGKSGIQSIFLDSFNLLKKSETDGVITEIYISAGNLTPVSSSQLALFADPQTIKTPANGIQGKLAQLCASLSAKYSSGVIITGKNLPVSRREQMLMFVDPLRMN